MSSTQQKYLQTIQEVFAKQQFRQLRLDFETEFVDPYNKMFDTNVDVAEIDVPMRNEAMILLKEQRFDIWLHYLNKCTSANRFVGATLLQSVLELILTINVKADEPSSNHMKRRIQTASLLFEKIVDNFPPAWSACFSTYKDLLNSPINIEIDFRKIRMNATDAIFPILIALLDDVLREPDDAGHDSENGFDSMMNFQEFEKVESQKCCFLKLTRNEKIERLMIVLNLLTKLMEIDLSTWMKRHPFQTKRFMADKNTRPLIGHLLWKDKDCGETTVLMRNIFSLFAMSTLIDFPDYADVLARLVHLMTVAVNLSEKCESDNLICYPNIKRLTETFAADLIRTIESYPYTIDVYINVLDNIRSPIICLLICLRVLNKFTKEFENVSLRKIVDSLESESYEQYDDKMIAESRRSNNSSNVTYPTYDPKNHKKASKHLNMNRSEYLTLIFHLCRSYVGVYRTHNLLHAMSTDEDDKLNIQMQERQFKSVHEKCELEKNHRVNYDLIMRDLNQLKSTAERLDATDRIPVAPFTPCQNVYLEPSDIVRYVEDLKYLVKLNKIIVENVQVGEAFKHWNEIVNP